MDQVEIIALGEEARIFFNSKIFIYLSEKAASEVDNAKQELVDVNAEDTKKIRELQNLVIRFDCFENWLKELILVGDATYEQYLEEGE